MTAQLQNNVIEEMQRRGIADQTGKKAFAVATAYRKLFQALNAACLGISRQVPTDIQKGATPITPPSSTKRR